MRSFLPLLAIFLFLSTSAICASSENRVLIRISGQNDNKALIKQIIQDGYEVEAYGEGWFDTVVPETYVPRLNRSYFKSYKKSPLSIQIRNLDLEFARHKIGVRKNRGSAYHMVDEINQALIDLASKYPEIAQVEVIGKSVEGRDIYSLKISDNVQKEEKEVSVLLMGALHAREWIAYEVPLYAAKKLCRGYGNDARLTKLINNREIYIVPLANPDGVHFSQTESKYWRKNRAHNAGSSYRGVDLNRNFGMHWGNVGASSNPYSDTYHGKKAFSEPETRAVRDLALKQKFSASLSYHSYSQLNLYPYGYGYNIPCPDTEILKKLARGMAKFNGYRAQNSADLYPAMGDSEDWLYGKMNVLAFTIELGRSFIPSPSQIPAIAEKNFKASLYLMEKAAEYSLVASRLDRQELINNLTLTEKGELLQALLEEQLARRVSWLRNQDDKKLMDLSLDRSRKLAQMEEQLVDELVILASSDLKQARQFIDNFRIGASSGDAGSSKRWMKRHFERKLMTALRFEMLTHPDDKVASLLDYLNK